MTNDQPSQSGSRILHTFDFEETALGNFESTPMFWSKVVGRGFPAYASGRFDHDIFRSANTSFRLDIDSGSAAYQFAAPEGRRILIDPNADYHIIAFVRTTPLQHARAEIAAWFADEQGHLLPQTECHSEPFADTAPPNATTAPQGWHVIHLFIPGPRPGSPEAAQSKSLSLQLALLQPQQLAGDGTKIDSPLGPFQLYQQDLKGTAWFDDITVFQLPRVSVHVPDAIIANIFNPGQAVDLDLTVADLAHGTAGSDATLGVALTITDPDGLLFASGKWSIATAPGRPWTHRYTHAPLPPGLYTATLDVTDNGGGSLISRRKTRFASLAAMAVRATESGIERPAPEFGICATEWPTAAWNELPAIVHDTNVGLVQLSAWRRDMSEAELRQRDPSFDATLGALQRFDVHLIGGFSELPGIVAAKLSEKPIPSVTEKSGDSLLALADADPALWKPYTSFVLARYAALVDHWELGSPAAPFSGSLNASMVAADDPYPALYTTCIAQLSSLLNQPGLIIPWNALFDFNPKLFPNAILDLRIPSVIKPAQIPSYVKDFKAASSNNIFVHIDPLEGEEYSPTDRVADFAQRIIYARSANPTATLINVPLLRRATPASPILDTEPTELLLVYRTLVRTLGNSVYRREVPFAVGIHAFLFAREDSGTLALWTDGAAGPQTSLDLPLGDSPRVVDMGGNVRTLTVDPTTHLTHIVLSSTPLLLDHVDPNLLELSATFAFATPVFPAGAGVVRTEVLLSNPYPDTFSATLHLMPPSGWTIDPPSCAVSIAPGGTFRQAVTIRYPYTESSGSKSIAAQLTSMNGGTRPGSTVGGASGAAGFDSDSSKLAMSRAVSVSSDSVETEDFARILPNGDLVVQQMITNIAATPLNTQAYALVPGYARQQRFVLNLAPGQTTIKRFLFPMSTYVDFTPKMTAADIAHALAGKSASLGLRQTDGKTLITKTIPLQ